MHFDVATLDGNLCYKLMTSLVVPRPIAWLVTNNGVGGQNAAPFSFFNCFSGNPPVLCIGIGRPVDRRKDSLANIERDREFVVNMVSEELAQAMNLTATDFPPDWNELALAGLETAPSVKISVPRIAASPAAFECRLREIMPVAQDSGNVIVVADVVAIHARDEAIINVERCHVDGSKLGIVGRMQSPGRYTRVHDTFEMRQATFGQWQAANPQVGKPD
ncbi:MAG: flavin reductase family protein [Burkholderiaceae bacterium]|nr:flavin reductase family protein [Burkholderiaceae bacterium]